MPIIIGFITKKMKIRLFTIPNMLTLGNLVWLGTEALGIGMDGVRFHTLPGDGMGYYRGESVYEVDPVAALALVNDALNPYVADITAEDMDVLVP